MVAMAATTSRDRSRSPARSGRRIVAVDAARGVALLAMMAVHVLPAVDLGRYDRALGLAL